MIDTPPGPSPGAAPAAAGSGVRPRLNLAAHAADFAIEAEARFSEVQRVVGTIDTLQLLFSQPLPPGSIPRLENANRGGVIARRSRCLSHPHLIRLQQPFIGALDFIASLTGQYLISRVDVAFDFHLRDGADLAEFDSFLRRHLIQRWHGIRRRSDFATTAYWGPTAARRNLAIYSDRPSKIDGTPVAHLELRLKGAGTCRARGLISVADIKNLSPISMLSRDVRLASISWRHLDRRIDALAARSFVIPGYPIPMTRNLARGRFETSVLRAGRTGEPLLTWAELRELPAQETLEYLGTPARKSAVYLRFDVLIKQHIPLIWP